MNQSGKGSPGHDRSKNAPDDTVDKYWPFYLAGGYFDDQDHLKIEYVSREQVEKLVKAMCEKDAPTSHQIRRYFNHCRNLETRLKVFHEAWGKVWPDVKRLDVAAADGVSKRPRKIPPLFHDFIRRNVATIKNQRDFIDGFLPHFEALVGFGQVHFKKERS